MSINICPWIEQIYKDLRPHLKQMLYGNLLFIGVLLAACAPFVAVNTETDPLTEQVRYYQALTHKPYEDVLAELKIAISEHNFRITAHSRVGHVIRKRGTKDFPDYDTIQFCNLTYARKLLELSPDSVRHMPCNMVLYTRSGQTVVQTRLLPVDTPESALNRFSEQMNQTLRTIVDFATEE